jgi:hypothetical protein
VVATVLLQCCCSGHGVIVVFSGVRCLMNAAQAARTLHSCESWLSLGSNRHIVG